MPNRQITRNSRGQWREKNEQPLSYANNQGQTFNQVQEASLRRDEEFWRTHPHKYNFASNPNNVTCARCGYDRQFRMHVN